MEGRNGSLESERPFPNPPDPSGIPLPDASAPFEGPADAEFLAKEEAGLLLPSNRESAVLRDRCVSPASLFFCLLNILFVS
jgi:hypothetical protein